jgi:hypothetical protein
MNSIAPTPNALAEIAVAKRWPHLSAFLPIKRRKSELKRGSAIRNTRLVEVNI